ncbi:MAG: hypothetical protein HY691_16745 [Chloroflexi bacterium]|nr:hypothetical protein [Chloroflexota bacterium]
MIVRIISEGQYRLDSALLDELNAVDAEIVAAVGQEDDARFRDLLARLFALVRERGRPLLPDELAPSDVVLPPPDLSLAEAKTLFVGEGLLPG